MVLLLQNALVFPLNDFITHDHAFLENDAPGGIISLTEERTVPVSATADATQPDVWAIGVCQLIT